MKKEKTKMKNDKENFKKEFKERIYKWVLKLINVIDNLPKGISTRVISNQLIRSGTSIGANYIEAQAASSRKDFTNYFHHSLKSANESKFWLELLRGSKKLEKGKINNLISELEEISNILATSILTLKGKK